MPCSGVVNVEIRCRKTLLLNKRIFGYDKLVLNNTKRGERYVLKVETVSLDETQRVRTIEVCLKQVAIFLKMVIMFHYISIFVFFRIFSY